MKRMHVHVAVEDLARSIGFYSALFHAQPAVVRAIFTHAVVLSTRSCALHAGVLARRQNSAQSAARQRPAETNRADTPMASSSSPNSKGANA